MKKKVLTTALLLSVLVSVGQQFTDLYGDYLGQKPPDDVPLLFASDLVSTKKLEHSSVVFSADGDIAIWCSVKNSIKQFWQIQRINNRWTKPQLLDLFGDSCKIGNDGPFRSGISGDRKCVVR